MSPTTRRRCSTAFLNPPEYFNSGDPSATPYTAEQAAGAIAMGSSDQTGNELDEFVVQTLRNNLLGCRSTCRPST